MNKATLSIDWEDFGQLYGMYHYGQITEPRHGAIERQTDIMLDMMEEANIKATFFILGMLARHRPQLVKLIQQRGHEIALHGMNHKPMFSLNRDEAWKDLKESNDLVTQITGEKLYGYRAPFFSVTEDNLYVLEMLAELGMEYDSSIFPVKMPRYGIRGFDDKDALYALPNGKNIVELPLTVATYFNKKWPVSGGGYIRLMPQMLVKKVFNDLEAESCGSMLYMHPYEFDNKSISVAANYPANVKYAALKVLALNLRWNIFRKSIKSKITSLLQQHEFVTCKQKAQYVKENGIGAKLLGCTK